MYFQVFKSQGQWTWRLCSARGEAIAEGMWYDDKAECLDAVMKVRHSGGATVYELESDPVGGGLEGDVST